LNREHLCGYDINLTYPQNGIIPSVGFIDARDRDVPFQLEKTMAKYKYKYAKRGLVGEVKRRYAELEMTERELIARRREKRDLRLRANGTLDPWVSERRTWVWVEFF
jgi:carboxypeptidase D